MSVSTTASSQCSPSHCRSSGSWRSPSTADSRRCARTVQDHYGSASGRRVAADCDLAARLSQVTLGLNCTCSVIDWVGFSVTGKTAPPTIEKPAPVIEAELTVTGEVPAEVSVNDCVVAVFTVTLPKLRLAVLTVNRGRRRCARTA